MKTLKNLPLLILSLLLMLPALAHSQDADALSSDSVKICFTPAKCGDLIISQINQAQKTIRVAAYSFTSKPIADALIEAIKRGVKVWIVVDKSNKTSKYSQAWHMRRNFVKVKFDTKHKIMHNKFIILDHKITITGSYNFTTSAQKSNAENVFVIQGTNIARQYKDEWGKHWYHSKY